MVQIVEENDSPIGLRELQLVSGREVDKCGEVTKTWRICSATGVVLEIPEIIEIAIERNRRTWQGGRGEIWPVHRIPVPAIPTIKVNQLLIAVCSCVRPRCSEPTRFDVSC